MDKSWINLDDRASTIYILTLHLSKKLKTTSLMRWHGEERKDDGVIRHPADSSGWKDFDNKHPKFASDVCNVRIGLTSHGFNPYRNMSLSHSTWPVVIIIYNLPSWLCMKQSFLLLSTLVNGPKGPGSKIDVYMQPLIEELKELWSDGVMTFDASLNQMFMLRAALLWIVSDFPAYAMVSGKSTKGEFTCPHCDKNIRSH
ncbi:hypothetical protein LIER_22290 [Lithospermum erythrorhizon]|uniref:Transposase n=1 Tax=Lithospermum erythrorhizon TaxID=34254 RepID=A0AAV3QUI0_LITER